MKLSRIVAGVSLVLNSASLVPGLAQTELAYLTNEHVDIRILYEPESTNIVRLVVRDEDHRIDYEPEEVVLVVGENARLALPAGTPFGNEGDPLWVLPQSQEPTLLYMGFSAEGLSAAVFSEPFTLRLKAIEGPGDFFVWQAAEFGSLVIKMNSRDGLDDADQTRPIIGSHEHVNWGFSKPGKYRVNLEVTGQRAGDSGKLTNQTQWLAFEVRPLPAKTGFAAWQEKFWPNGASESVQGAAADPDGDGLANVVEYASGTDPTKSDAPSPLNISIVTSGSDRLNAVTFLRPKSAADLDIFAEAAPAITGPWTKLEDVLRTEEFGGRERVTVRDPASLESTEQHFYRLRVGLR